MESEHDGDYSLGKAYGSLAKIIQANPDNKEITDRAFELFWKALESEKNDKFSLITAYEKLTDIIQSNPNNKEIIDRAGEAYGKALESKENSYKSLCRAYESLTSIIQANPNNPEIINLAFELFGKGVESEKNDEDSLDKACESLATIIQSNPNNKEITDRAFELFEKNLESGTGTVKSYKALTTIIQSNPNNKEITDRAFELFGKTLESEKNGAWSLGVARRFGRILLHRQEKNGAWSLGVARTSLVSIIQANPNNPKITDRAFDLFGKALESEKNDKFSLITAYEKLTDIIQANPNNPKITDRAFDLFGKALESEKNDKFSLITAYEKLTDIIQANPNNKEITDRAFDLFGKALESEKNDEESLDKACEYLTNIIKANPNNKEITDRAFELFGKTLESEHTDEYSIGKAYESLVSIIQANPDNPEITDRTLKLFGKALESKENGYRSLCRAYQSLTEIIQANPSNPKITDRAFDLFGKTLESEKNDEDSLLTAYEYLTNIIKANPNNPEIADRTLELFGKALESKYNASNSLSTAYESLNNMVQSNPKLVEKIIPLCEKALQENPNIDHSSIYHLFDSMLDSRPDLTEKIFSTAEKQYDGFKNVSYCELMEKIIKNNPAYQDRVLERIIQAESPRIVLPDTHSSSDENNPDNDTFDDTEYNDNDYDNDYGDDTFDDFDYDEDDEEYYENQQDEYEPIHNRNGLSLVRPSLLALCLKGKSREYVESIEGINQDSFLSAWNLRNSMGTEVSWLWNHISVSELKDFKISAQQKCLNVIFTMIGRENNIDPTEIKLLRSPKVSSDIKELFEENADWILPSSHKCAQIFGSEFPNYVKQLTEFGVNIHDATYWLPKPMTPEKNKSFKNFINNNIIYADINGKKHVRPQDELSVISQNWASLNPEEEKLPYKALLDVCRSRKYHNQKYADFATIAARNGVFPKRYKEFETIYSAGLDVPEPFDTSKRYVSKDGRYVGRFLPRDDPRTGFFGGYTSCCQHFNGIGKTCALSTIKDPFSQLFVVEDAKGNIIAGSWTWENTEGKYRNVCFDNIEAIGEHSNAPWLNEMYEDVAKDLCDNQNCHTVSIGLGYQDANIGNYPELAEGIPLPKAYGDGYTDARSQVLLRKNPLAKPLDKSKESLRFIRNVCCEDIPQMRRISAQCFPDSDRGLVIPTREEDRGGKVLVDYDKGVVGYCLYDERENHIYDMAVLPEYRKDENASSRKLLASVMKDLAQKNDEWTAELRDQTSLRLLKTMAQRGIIDLEVGSVDHTMSDGSLVYSAKFKILSSEERKQREAEQTKMPVQPQRTTHGKDNPTQQKSLSTSIGDFFRA